MAKKNTDFGWYIEQSQLGDLHFQLTGIHYPYIHGTGMLTYNNG